MSSELVLYELVDGIATITLNRPEVANAQNMELLDELDAAWTRADRDPDAKVVVLRANGKHFSSGHDIDPKSWDNGGKFLVSDIYETETRRYLDYSLKWRNCSKPSIAAVQGVCIAGGLLLAWPCDLIVAAENARFSDPVLAMGIGGVEYHAHTWELGTRLAKEILFTGRAINADEAYRVGMVNRVVPRDELEAATTELASAIAQKHPFALRMAKRAVNQTQDIQGFTAAVRAVFDIHQLGHAHAISETGQPVIMALDGMKSEVSKQKDSGSST